MRHLIVVLLTLIAACSSDTTDTSRAALVCTPGEQVACACPGGVQGAQACRDDGAGYHDCDCSAAGSSGASGASGTSAGSSGTGGSAGMGGTGGVAGTGGTSGAGGTGGTTVTCKSTCVDDANGYPSCGMHLDTCGQPEECGTCNLGTWPPGCVVFTPGEQTVCVPGCFPDNQAGGFDVTGCFDAEHPAVLICKSQELGAFWASQWAPDCLGPSVCESMGLASAFTLGCTVDHAPTP